MGDQQAVYESSQEKAPTSDFFSTIFDASSSGFDSNT
jgi:hypothetical protein